MPYQVLQLHPHLTSLGFQAQFFHRMASPRRIFAGDPDWQAPMLDALHPEFPQAALACDVLVIHTLASPEIEAVIRLRRAFGKPTVYEIPDNYLALDDMIDDNHVARSPLYRQTLLYYAWLCNGLQVSSPGLAWILGRVNPNVVVFDNHVPCAPRLPEKPAGFHFGWGGTRGHQADLEWIAPVVVQFCRSHPDAVFAFQGDRDVFDACFRGIPPAQTRVSPFGPYATFQEFLRSLHVGLAPLLDTPANRGRTDVKFAEYAAQGVAAVLADSPVYRPHAARARLFATPAELAAILEELYADRSQITDLAERAYAWVTTYRSPAVLSASRRQFYQSLLGPTAKPSDAPAPSDCRDLCDQLAAARDAYRAGEFDTSLRVCRELLRIRPGYEQAQWLLASSLEGLGRESEALAFLDTLNASPVFHDVFTDMQVRLARRVCPDRARQYADRLHSPVRRLRFQAPSATTTGEERDRAQLAFYRRVLSLQPFDYFALMTVIRLLMRHQPESLDLPQLRERARLVAGDSAPADWLPAELTPYLVSK
jgi:hypothetical protein